MVYVPARLAVHQGAKDFLIFVLSGRAVNSGQDQVKDLGGL